MAKFPSELSKYTHLNLGWLMIESEAILELDGLPEQIRFQHLV